MSNRYEWTKEFIEELKKLNEADADYLQVEMLRKMDRMWSSNIDSLIKEMTYEEPLFYIVRMKNEITDVLYDYLEEYISKDYYLSKCIHISNTETAAGRKHLYLEIDRSIIRPGFKTYGFHKAVTGINYKAIAVELSGIDNINDHWVTASIYQAFKKGMADNHEWPKKYCEDIICTLEKIREEIEAKKHQFFQFDSKHIPLEQIAPCGLICSVCEHALYDDPPCPGCREEGEGKIEFCKSVCRIPKCEKRLKNDWAFCNQCPDYPCEEVAEKQVRYTSKYPLLENPMALQDRLQSNGVTKTLKELEEEWICPECGEFICVHTGTCKNHCSKEKS